MHPDNLGKQFNELIGSNFSNEEVGEAKGRAIGEHMFNQIEGVLGSYRGAVEHEANQRMGLFPEHMMSIDEEGRHVSYTSPSGWKHTWHGGSYIEHSHPKHGPVEVTNVSNKEGTPSILAPSEFMQHCEDAEKSFEADYNPKDWR